MSRPQYYQPLVAACKPWALKNSKGISTTKVSLTNLKDPLKSITAGLGMLQSLTREIYGKLVYIAKMTDALTTKVSRLSQDLRIVDSTFM